MTFPLVPSIHPPRLKAPLVDVARWFPPWKRCHKRPSPLHLDELPESEEKLQTPEVKGLEKLDFFELLFVEKPLGITGVVKSADEFVFEEFFKKRSSLWGLGGTKPTLNFHWNFGPKMYPCIIPPKNRQCHNTTFGWVIF